MESLRTAKAWGSTPMTFLGWDTDGRWYEQDRLLARALDVYEATRIDHLGFPKRRTEEGDNEGYIEKQWRFNAAQQALDLDKDEKHDAGMIPYLVDTRN